MGERDVVVWAGGVGGGGGRKENLTKDSQCFSLQFLQ